MVENSAIERINDYISGLEKRGEHAISFEVVPTERGVKREEMDPILREMSKYARFVAVTAHSSEVVYREKEGGEYEKIVVRMRAGTGGICGHIQDVFGVAAIAHVLRRGFSIEETKQYLLELRDVHDVKNILILNGKRKQNHRKIEEGEIYSSVTDMIKKIREEYLGFCIGVAGHPEKNPEIPNMAREIKILKGKQEAGADYVFCQICFDYKTFLNYVNKCREAGITLSFVPGVAILTKKHQLSTIPRQCSIDIPEGLEEIILSNKDNSEKMIEQSVDWTVEQIEELYKAGFPLVHLYTFLSSHKDVKGVIKPIDMCMERLKGRGLVQY